MGCSPLRDSSPGKPHGATAAFADACSRRAGESFILKDADAHVKGG
jgi:hypothetical protein